MPELTRSQRRERRLRELVAVLADHPQGLTWSEAWPLVTERVPLVPHDEQTGSSGQVVGENDVRYSLTSLDKTGWVLTGVGSMRITVTGRRALTDLPDAHDFWLAASKGYDEWKVWRDAARDEGPDTSDPSRRWPLETGESAMLRVSRDVVSPSAP